MEDIPAVGKGTYSVIDEVPVGAGGAKFNISEYPEGEGPDESKN